jgi:hypothetical protein
MNAAWARRINVSGLLRTAEFTVPNAQRHAGLIRTVKHADGTQRRRMAGGDAAPALNDVALLSRFEVLVTAAGGDRLDLFDITTGRTVVVDSAWFTVLGHGGLPGGPPGPRLPSHGTPSTSRARPDPGPAQRRSRAPVPGDGAKYRQLQPVEGDPVAAVELDL